MTGPDENLTFNANHPFAWSLPERRREEKRNRNKCIAGWVKCWLPFRQLPLSHTAIETPPPEVKKMTESVGVWRRMEANPTHTVRMMSHAEPQSLWCLHIPVPSLWILASLMWVCWSHQGLGVGFLRNDSLQVYTGMDTNFFVVIPNGKSQDHLKKVQMPKRFRHSWN